MSTRDYINKYILERVKQGIIDEENALLILKEINRGNEPQNTHIAIIGMSCRFPGSADKNEYWNHIKNKKCCVGEFPEGRRKDVDAFLDVDGSDLGDLYAKGGYLDNIDKFDAAFFRISPEEARLMDPLQRIFLETAYEAMEDAGYGGRKLYGTRTGVFVGRDHTCESEYKHMTDQTDMLATTGSWTGILASRVSYVFNLRGPGMVIDTACSSALVALHLACKSLKIRECSMAIAGGINIFSVPRRKGRLSGIQSTDDRLKAFDNNADGTVWGEGVGAVLLKPLAKALEDRDNIYAVIKGSAINSDGASNGITAPNAEAQEEVILRAWDEAKINPETLGYIETHGAGTVLGDPIEINGLTKAFRRYTGKKQFCAIGSVKTNIGHTVSASGMAALFKVVMALKDGIIPAGLYFDEPNRYIDFCNSPVYVNSVSRQWKRADTPRRAGISSFGISGTNCHVVLEEMPGKERPPEADKTQTMILTLSARSMPALNNLAKRYVEFFSKELEASLHDAAYTANTGKGHYNFRATILFHNRRELIEKLSLLENQDIKELSHRGIYFGEHRLINNNRVNKAPGDITEEEKRLMSKEAASKIEQLADHGRDTGRIFEDICKMYVRGAHIDWEDIYKGQALRRVSLPVYPLERIRHWIAVKGFPARGLPAKVQKQDNRPGFYTIGCVREEIHPDLDIGSADGSVLIFKDDRGIGREIGQKLKNKGIDVIEVSMGGGYRKATRNTYFIGSRKEDYDLLFEDINEKKLSHIIHLFSIRDKQSMESTEDIEKIRDTGVYSLFCIAKNIIHRRIKNGIELLTVCENVKEITGEEKHLNPYDASLYGFGKVLSQEQGGLNCRYIDIEAENGAEKIIAELYNKTPRYYTAYRNGCRYTEVLKDVDISALEHSRLGVKSEGVYIIAGGAGGIGLEIAKYLALKNKVNLALVGRSEISGRSRWASIETEGSNVEYFTADISRLQDMQQVYGSLKKKYGRINGIIHCAGEGGYGLVGNQEEREFKKALTSKMQGTWVLDKLSEEDDLDLFLMFSSVTTLVGGPGVGAYAAANACLDAFAPYRRRNGKKTRTITWPALKDIGLLAGTSINDHMHLFKPMSAKEAVDTLEELLNRDASHIICGRLNYEIDILCMDELLPFKLSENVKKLVSDERNPFDCELAQNEAKREVQMKGRKDGDFTATERLLATIWGEVLGLEEINIYDNLHELGGDSIQSMKIVNKLNRKMNIRVSVTEFINCPTIFEFAAYLDAKTVPGSGKPAANNTYPEIKPAEAKAYYPVSSAQKRMLVLKEIEGAGIGYNITRIMEVHGELRTDKLEEAFRKLVERHEALRTSFELVDGEPVQIVHDEADFHVSHIKADKDGIRKEIERFAEPFDFSKAPLFRVALARLSENHHLLMFDIHHIIADRVSVNIIIQEFALLYEGKMLPALRVHYKDFSIWQNQLFKSEMIIEQEKRWLEQFKGEIPVLNMPLDYERPRIRNFKGDIVHFALNEEMTSRMKKVAQNEGATLFMTLLTVYNILLARYCAQEDIVIGCPIAGRSIPELESMVGMFANSLAMRNFPQSEKTFRVFLKEVRDNALGAYENQDYQFEELVKALNLQRDLGRNPLFDVLFLLHNADFKEMGVSSLVFEPFEYENNVTRFDLTLEALEKDGKILFGIDYFTGIFKRETVERLAGYYLKIAEQVISNPDIKIGEIDLLEKDYREQLLSGIKLTEDSLNSDFNF